MSKSNESGTAVGAVGKSIPRRDAEDKLRGQTKYTVDVSSGPMLHAVLRRAEVPAGRIMKLDLEPARRMPGVRAVIGLEDAPGLYGIMVADHPLFADETIRYNGEPVAVVAAETIEQAQAGADAIVLEIEAEAPLITMADAIAPGAREIHPNWRDHELLAGEGARSGNVAWEATAVRGDVDAAFARDDVTVIETTFRSGRQNQTPLEPRAVVATYENGRFVLTTSTQFPWAVRNATAKILGVAGSDVRVMAPAVGGGFGMKFEPSLEPFAAILARETGRPVRLVISRQEEMQTALSRENSEIRIRSAVTADGEIASREALVLIDCGAYSGEQAFLASMVTHTLMGNYRFGSSRIVTQAIYTNTPPTGAFRACSGVYATAALEQHTDAICRQMGFDRIEFRKQNVLGDGDVGPTGATFDGDVLGAMLERMDTLRQKSVTERPATDDGLLYGTATTVGTWFIFVGPSAATVNLNPDGSATLITAGVEIGSGSTMQAIPQIVADALQISVDDVVVREADTDAAGYDGGVGGGRTTVSIGAAGAAAAADVKRKVLDLAADMLEASPTDLTLDDGKVVVKGSPSVSVTIKEVAAHAQATTGPISGSGSFTGINNQAVTGCAAGHYIGALDLPVFAVHEADVAVDPLTGHVTVLDYRVVQDVGRAINPRAIDGQVQGGVVQGLGFALHEAVTFDEDGKIRETGFGTYRVPLSGDVVPVKLDMFEGAPSFGPMGAKGAGEVPILNVPAVISCAVADAIGKHVDQIPLTPPLVLATMLDHEDAKLNLDHVPTDWRTAVVGDAEHLLAIAPK